MAETKNSHHFRLSVGAVPPGKASSERPLYWILALIVRKTKQQLCVWRMNSLAGHCKDRTHSGLLSKLKHRITEREVADSRLPVFSKEVVGSL